MVMMRRREISCRSEARADERFPTIRGKKKNVKTTHPNSLHTSGTEKAPSFGCFVSYRRNNFVLLMAFEHEYAFVTSMKKMVVYRQRRSLLCSHIHHNWFFSSFLGRIGGSTSYIIFPR